MMLMLMMAMRGESVVIVSRSNSKCAPSMSLNSAVMMMIMMMILMMRGESVVIVSHSMIIIFVSNQCIDHYTTPFLTRKKVYN